VFHALGLGLLNKEIAQSLGLSLQTVETYRKHISAKLALSGSEMIRAATLHRCTNPVGAGDTQRSQTPGE
jgi:DNA-binding NarL/FixJ family response regulator